MTLSIFKLFPIAEPDDPNWYVAANRGVVFVRAASSGDARLVAAEAETRLAGDLAKPNDDVYSVRASAFTDDKLYGVTEVSDTDLPKDGPRDLVSGLEGTPDIQAERDLVSRDT